MADAAVPKFHYIFLFFHYHCNFLEKRTCREHVEVDSMCTSLMLGAQTQIKVNGQGFPDVELLF